MSVRFVVIILFLGLLHYYGQDKIIGYYDYNNTTDYIISDKHGNNKIYLFKNGNYIATRSFPSLSTFFDSYDESTANFFIIRRSNIGEIVLGAERGTSLKTTTVLYFKYVSRVNNWLFYKKEDGETGTKDRLTSINIKYYPYSLGIDGKEYPPNEKLYLQDSLKNKQVSETIFNEEYNKLKCSKNLRKYNFKYSYEDLYLLTKNIPITKTTLDKYNNLAYYLSQNEKEAFEAIYLYNQIIEKYPDRVVTYLNLADSYWAIGNQELAKENYQKYVELMKSQKKDLTKIPKYVWERGK